MVLDKKPEKEVVAWVLDYLPYGSPDDKRPVYQKKPIIQAVGEKNFVLMEITPREGVTVNVEDRIHIGDKNSIGQVKRRITYDGLSNSAKMELPILVNKIILENESRFVEFFNKAYPITSRFHMLELLPGIGKKLMWALIEERKKGDFKSFQDLTERVKNLHYPERLITNRIIEELKDDHIKYRVFTTPFPKKG